MSADDGHPTYDVAKRRRELADGINAKQAQMPHAGPNGPRGAPPAEATEDAPAEDPGPDRRPDPSQGQGSGGPSVEQTATLQEKASAGFRARQAGRGYREVLAEEIHRGE